MDRFALRLSDYFQIVINIFVIDPGPLNVFIKKTGHDCRFRYWLHVDRTAPRVGPSGCGKATISNQRFYAFTLYLFFKWSNYRDLLEVYRNSSLINIRLILRRNILIFDKYICIKTSKFV
jgi:hypothetical protein